MLVGKAIIKLGGIEEITLPYGWAEVRYKLGSRGQRIFREHCAPAAHSVTLSLCCNEHPLEAQPRLALLQILQLGAPTGDWTRWLPHNQYFHCIEEPRQFLLVSARIGQLKGRRSLELDGYNATTMHTMRVVIFDTESGGTLPMSICYSAPEDLYLEYLTQFNEALASVLWRRSVLSG